ncbi:HupE/UreJ family protein, partial [Alcanivorax sp. HI0083]|uniref:HupE/UreJ family protein n=1 Tax=Alcanivorax sp. HI0083 TaxID=1822258 RepID=UPI000B2823F4
HGMSAEDKARALNAGFMEYIELGAMHMVTGYDHLLFLFGVVFFLTRFSDIVRFITAFSIGHSITLVFATLYSIQANYYLVDAVIALTVCYKAFDNLGGFKTYLKMKSPNLMWMVFAFGLIHGFGLSTRLQQLPLAEDGLVFRILAFNVGVELGQIAALAIMLFLLSGWRRMASFKRFSQATNGLLMVLGLLLLLMQLHGYLHSSNPDEFPLNKDDHQHTHEDMGVANSPLSGYEKRFDLDAEEVLTVRLKQRVVSRRSCQTVPLILTPMVTAKPMYINKFDLFL